MAESTLVIELTDENFEDEVENGEGFTVVDFWAPWCGPCRLVGPIIEQLAEEYAGDVRFAKLNVDEAPAISQTFGIRSIPTIGFFRDGVAVGGVVGAYPKDALKEAIEKARTESGPAVA
jgi:thioredoxin 1